MENGFGTITEVRIFLNLTTYGTPLPDPIPLLQHPVGQIPLPQLRDSPFIVRPAMYWRDTGCGAASAHLQRFLQQRYNSIDDLVLGLWQWSFGMWHHEQLTESLTAHHSPIPGIIPHLPYVLPDIWYDQIAGDDCQIQRAVEAEMAVFRSPQARPTVPRAPATTTPAPRSPDRAVVHAARDYSSETESTAAELSPQAGLAAAHALALAAIDAPDPVVAVNVPADADTGEQLAAAAADTVDELAAVDAATEAAPHAAHAAAIAASGDVAASVDSAVDLAAELPFAQLEEDELDRDLPP